MDVAEGRWGQPDITAASGSDTHQGSAFQAFGFCFQSVRTSSSCCAGGEAAVCWGNAVTWALGGGARTAPGSACFSPAREARLQSSTR